MLKKYICKGCGVEQDLDLNPSLVTFPQCSICGSIMHENIQYNSELTEYIPQLEQKFKEFFKVPCVVQLIKSNRNFKIRWYNGPTKEEVQDTKEFIDFYKSIATILEIPKWKQISKRTFKQYGREN